jgi:predicted nucleotidyltransferase
VPGPVEALKRPPEALPAAVRSWLSQVSQTLIDSLGEELESLILFGSAAEGLMRASSDVNLLIVLSRFDPERIDRASAVLQDAAAAVELHPMFLLASEVPLAAESFSVKFDDIAHRHVVLYGTDPFEILKIPRALLVKRLQQVLFNLTLRLRTLYAVGRDHRARRSLPGFRRTPGADCKSPRGAGLGACATARDRNAAGRMNTNPLEILLARLLSSPNEVEQFLQDRERYARNCGLAAAQVTEILEFDAASLRFAANSFERKRGSHGN